MNIDSLRYILLFVIISIAQVIILSNIRLFGFATPMLQIYFILRFRRGYPQSLLLLWAFAMGLILDSFANTPGIGTASMTLIALIQPYLLESFMQRESEPDLKPSLASLGLPKYLLYSTVITLTYCLTFFTLENFSFFNFSQWILSIIGCFIFTLIVVIVFESVRNSQ